MLLLRQAPASLKYALAWASVQMSSTRPDLRSIWAQIRHRRSSIRSSDRKVWDLLRARAMGGQSECAATSPAVLPRSWRARAPRHADWTARD
eukprot:558508-Pyramimonas_sp.AAC.1